MSVGKHIAELTEVNSPRMRIAQGCGVNAALVGL